MDVIYPKEIAEKIVQTIAAHVVLVADVPEAVRADWIARATELIEVGLASLASDLKDATFHEKEAAASHLGLGEAWARAVLARLELQREIERLWKVEAAARALLEALPKCTGEDVFGRAPPVACSAVALTRRAFAKPEEPPTYLCPHKGTWCDRHAPSFVGPFREVDLAAQIRALLSALEGSK